MFANLPKTGRLATPRNASAELAVALECGARIVVFRAAGRHFLQPTTQATPASTFTYGFAAFPLMPYSGPIFGDGFWHALDRNIPTEPTATHGEGRSPSASWKIEPLAA
jgi:aldose 1-epimerase